MPKNVLLESVGGCLRIHSTPHAIKTMFTTTVVTSYVPELILFQLNLQFLLCDHNIGLEF